MARPSQGLGSGHRCKPSLVPRSGLFALPLAHLSALLKPLIAWAENTRPSNQKGVFAREALRPQQSPNVSGAAFLYFNPKSEIRNPQYPHLLSFSPLLTPKHLFPSKKHSA